MSGTTMLDACLIGTARRLPRGGYRLLQLAAQVFPHLRRYPVTLTRLQGITLECDLRDRICFPLLKHGYYPHQIAEEGIFARLCANAHCIVDVGANIGYTAALFAQSAPDARVFAFEPARKCAPYLAQISRLYQQVMVNAVAVSDHEGQATFVEHARLDLSHLGGDGDRDGRLYTVPVTTLDLWRQSHPKVDFLKIDVEGYERAVIAGAEHMLRTDRPIVAYEALTSEMAADLNARFEALEFETARIAHDGQLIPSTAQADGLTNNYIAFPRETAGAFRQKIMVSK